MRGCTMVRLKNAAAFSSAMKVPPPLNDKAGNFAGVGENGLQ
jgi:hypothetical protein